MKNILEFQIKQLTYDIAFFTKENDKLIIETDSLSPDYEKLAKFYEENVKEYEETRKLLIGK